ncbi:MAG: helix-turn-helix domain-containing protein [Anaerolineales bacterium]|nr:helix-turn-helix domain-containing protein [Anaerolineales bacterium]
MTTNQKVLLRDRVLGVLMRDARLASGRTLEECAAFLGLEPDELAAIELGRKQVTLPKLEAFAFLVDVPIDHFFGDQLLEGNGKRAPAGELYDLRNRVIGALIRQARSAAGITLASCAEAMGISEQTLLDYERGRTAIPLSVLHLLSEELNVPTTIFLDKEYNPLLKKIKGKVEKDVFDHLPKELENFLLEPLNADFIETAFRLSKLGAGDLRRIAEALLEITY